MKRSVVVLSAVIITVTLLILTIVGATYATPTPDRALPQPIQRHEPPVVLQSDKAQETFVISYAGQSPPAELMQTLRQLQAAGRVTAVDADSIPGRIFVLSQITTLQPLRQLRAVTALEQADLKRDRPAQQRQPASAVSALNQPEQTHSGSQSAVFHVVLRSSLPQPERTRLMMLLKAWEAAGKLQAVSERAGIIKVTAFLESKVQLSQLPGVQRVDELVAQPRQIDRVTANATITGVVTAEENGTPLAGVDVCAINPWDWTGTTYCTSTNASGTYSVSVPPQYCDMDCYQAFYQISFTPHDNHIPECYNNVSCASYSFTYIYATDGGLFPNINASLSLGARIRGRVVSAYGGSPLPNIAVHAEEMSSGFAGDGTTDTAGIYTTTSIPNGSYVVHFSASNGIYAAQYYTNAYRPAQAAPVIVGGADVPNINAALIHGGAITGVVTAGGAPLSTGYVYLYYGAEYTFIRYEFTDSNGKYVLSGLGPVSYTLYFGDGSGVYLPEWYKDKSEWANASPLNISDNLTTTVNAELAASGTIAGVVTAGGSDQLLGNISAAVYKSDTQQYVGSATTDLNGAYRVGGLAQGTYKVVFSDYNGFYLTEWYNNKTDFNSANPVNVSGGLTSTVNAQLALGGTVTGLVTGDDTGLPLSDVQVGVNIAPDQWRVAYTDNSGQYRIGGLPAAYYKMAFWPSDDIHLFEYFNNKPDLNSADLISVTAGTTRTVNAGLAVGARLTGRVTAASSGAGLSDVDVEVWTIDSTIGGNNTTTDASGYYTLTGLPSAVYHANFYPDARKYTPESYNNFRMDYGFTPVTVTAPLTRSNINAALEARIGYFISGTVSGPGPLQDVYVEVYRGADDYHYDYALTDAQGHYQIGPLDPAQYRVRFWPADEVHASEWYNNSATYYNAQLISLYSDQANVNATLEMGGFISGTVTGTGGVPLSGVSVYVHSQGDTYSYVGYASTDSQGRYVSTGLHSGKYRVEFSKTGYNAEWYNDTASADAAYLVTVTEGATTSNVNAQLSAISGGPTGAITGTVTAGDTGSLYPVWVYAYSVNGDYSYSAYASGGMYQFSGLPIGPYRLEFSVRSPYLARYYNNKTEWNKADIITVTAGVTTTVNGVVPRGGALTGIVTGSGALPGVLVTARETSICGINYYYRYFTAYTGIDGRYRIDGLEGCTYRVDFAPPTPYIHEWYNNQTTPSNYLTVSVAVSNVVPNINAALSTGGVITGLVTAADTHRPLAGAWAGIYNSSNTYLGFAYIDMSGRYQTPGLAAGNYKISFEPWPWSDYVPEWYNNALASNTALNVSVPASGVTANINAELTRGGSISGVAYDGKTGLPVGYDVNINVYDPGSGTYPGYAYTNGWGWYQVTGLPAGQYRVSFDRWSPIHVTQYYSKTISSAAATLVGVVPPNNTPYIDAYFNQRQVYLPLIRR